jgi:hypothetical protein
MRIIKPKGDEKNNSSQVGKIRHHRKRNFGVILHGIF